MGSAKRIDFSLIIQSIPSLLISLIGLSISGKILDIEQNKKYADTYPIILLSNCILSFKGNTELIYAMYLSTTSQVKDHTYRKFIKFAIDNGCLVLAQSVIIGVSVGILGLARNVIGKISADFIVPKMIAICLLSSFISTLLIIALLVPSILFALYIGINPDNIVLPVIASVGDFLDIAILIYFIKKYQFASPIMCYIPILIVFAITPILIYYSMLSSRRIPIQSVYILVLTYILSTFSSYMIQIFSKRHLVLASSYPIFCGLTGASSYIYLNRKVTALQNNIPHNRERCFLSVILASIIIAFATTLFMPLLGIYFKKSFSILFVSGFVIIVAILLKIIDVMMKFFVEDSAKAGVVGLPLITSIADFLSAVMVLTICFVIFGF